MEKSHLVKTIQRYCPFCDEVHMLEKRMRRRPMRVKGEKVLFDEFYFVCPKRAEDDENMFVPAGLLDRNMQNARNAYRAKHSLLTSDEIIAIRKACNMSQKDLALVLGLEAATVKRYETKSIQNEAYDQILRMFRACPDIALDQLVWQKSGFNTDKYRQLRSAVYLNRK